MIAEARAPRSERRYEVKESEGSTRTGLSDADVATVLQLLKGADTVELKVSIPASAHRATIQGLPMDPVEAQPRQVFFFDTPDLALNRSGVVVRARRRQGGVGDTVVKLRPVVPADLPAEVRRSPSFNVEVDALPGGFVCSGSYKGRCTGQEVIDAARGAAPLRKLLSKQQRAFYKAHAPADLGLDSLVPMGPTFLLKSRFQVKKLQRLMVGELWLYPDGSRILELSTKCLPAEAFQVAAMTRAYLADRGISIGGEQQTKTKAALEFYSAELRAASAGPEAGEGPGPEAGEGPGPEAGEGPGPEPEAEPPQD